MDRLPRLSSRLAAFGVIALGACGRSDVASVEPCMPLDELLARTPGLERDDFSVENLGELRTRDLTWTQLSFSDGTNTLLTWSEVKAYLATYKGRITEACTARLFGGPIAELPEKIGVIEGSLLASGFAVERSTPGAFFSTSRDELLRQRHYVRDDYLVILAVDLELSGQAFMFDVCVMSAERCRSPGLLDLQNREQKLLDDYAPRVAPSRESAPPAPAPEHAP